MAASSPVRASCKRSACSSLYSSLDDSRKSLSSDLVSSSVGEPAAHNASRLSTVIDADRIYVLDTVQVVEQGTHVELLARNGLYAELSRMQLTTHDTEEPVSIQAQF